MRFKNDFNWFKRAKNVVIMMGASLDINAFVIMLRRTYQSHSLVSLRRSTRNHTSFCGKLLFLLIAQVARPRVADNDVSYLRGKTRQ